MIRYEDILKRISTIEKKKTRNEERIKVLTEENITLSSNLKLLNQKKELLEKMEVDLNNIFGTNATSVDKNLSTDVASNVFDRPKTYIQELSLRPNTRRNIKNGYGFITILISLFQWNDCWHHISSIHSRRNIQII